MILLGIINTPCSYNDFLTSAVDSNETFLALLTSPNVFMSSKNRERLISATVPSKLKKPSSLHSKPTSSQMRFIKLSGMILLVRDDSTSTEWTILSRFNVSLDQQSNQMVYSIGFCWDSDYSQFSSILKMYQPN